LTGYLAEHYISFNSIDHLEGLLKSIFPDSKICQKINLKRSKATNIINNVIAPCEKENLTYKLQHNQFSILIDESTDIASESILCIIVRIFDSEVERIVSRFWNLVQVHDKNNPNSGATANNLFNSVMNSFEKYNIPDSNVIRFSSDECNAMFGKNNSVVSRLYERFPGIYTMKCICRSLYLVASEACKQLPRSCEELARNIYSFFSHSAKRQSDFVQFQTFAEVKIHKILHPSQTRWLSLTTVVTYSNIRTVGFT